MKGRQAWHPVRRLFAGCGEVDKDVLCRGGGERRRLRRLGALLVLWAAAMPTMAQPAAPAHWIRYAQSAGDRLQEGLSDGSSGLAVRLHAWLEKRATNDRLMGRSMPMVVRVWISGDGRVERTEFDSLGDIQADEDLRALLSLEPLPAPPPDMRQPLVLRLELEAAPAGENAARGDASLP